MVFYPGTVQSSGVHPPPALNWGYTAASLTGHVLWLQGPASAKVRAPPGGIHRQWLPGDSKVLLHCLNLEATLKRHSSSRAPQGRQGILAATSLQSSFSLPNPAFLTSLQVHLQEQSLGNHKQMCAKQTNALRGRHRYCGSIVRRWWNWPASFDISHCCDYGWSVTPEPVPSLVTRAKMNVWTLKVEKQSLDPGRFVNISPVKPWLRQSPADNPYWYFFFLDFFGDQIKGTDHIPYQFPFFLA